MTNSFMSDNMSDVMLKIAVCFLSDVYDIQPVMNYPISRAQQPTIKVPLCSQPSWLKYIEGSSTPLYWQKQLSITCVYHFFSVRS